MLHKLYLDAETMGLNTVLVKDGKEIIGAKEYKMIEVGVILTDMNENIIDMMDASIKINMSDIDNADPWSVEHHTKTGLLDKCLASQETTKIVEKKIIDFLESNNIEKRVLLAGQSAHFDKEFMKYQMPELSTKVNHQTFDISTLRYHYQDKYPGVMSALDKIKEEHYDHTALNDIAFSLIAGRVYDGMAVGDFSRGDELTENDKVQVDYIKNDVFDKLGEYRLNQNNDKAHEVEIANFSTEDKIIQVASEDPDSWSDDIASAKKVTFDLKLDIQTSVRIDAVYQKDKNPEGCEIKISFLKQATKDTLAEYIENKDFKYGYMPLSRKQEIIDFCSAISDKIKDKKSSKMSIEDVPNILSAYLSGNAFEYRKESYVANHKDLSVDQELN